MFFLLLSAAAWALPVRAQKCAEAPSLPVMKVTEVEDFQTRDYPGSMVPVAQVHLISRVNGEILKLGFTNGDLVKEGDVLYTLDSIKYEAAVKEAKAQVAELKAQISYAKNDYERNKTLSDSKTVSLDAVENALSTFNALQASLDAAEANLISAQYDLDHCQIKAPISGKIGSTNFTEGNYVTPTSGTLVTLIQASPIRVRFPMSNRDFLRLFGGSAKNIRENGLVKLTLADGSAFPEDGAIEYVDNAANQATDTIQVFARFPNKDHILKPGGTVLVALSSKVGVKRPAVAPTAVLQDVQGSFVWVVDGQNAVKKQYVVRGGVVDNLQLIESGLSAGETVVTDGTHKVTNGETIQPILK